MKKDIFRLLGLAIVITGGIVMVKSGIKLADTSSTEKRKKHLNNFILGGVGIGVGAILSKAAN